MTITHTNVPATLRHIWPQIFPRFEGSISGHDWGIEKEYVILKSDDELEEAINYLRLWVKFKCREVGKQYFEDVFIFRPAWKTKDLYQNATAEIKVLCLGEKIEFIAKDGKGRI